MNGRADTSLPLLILTDARTASASEVVAAALRDNKRAILFGTRTLGKSVAQAVMILSSGSGVSLTIRSFVSPAGKSMENGVEPDFDTHGAAISLKELKWNADSKVWCLGKRRLDHSSISCKKH